MCRMCFVGEGLLPECPQRLGVGPTTAICSYCAVGFFGVACGWFLCCRAVCSLRCSAAPCALSADGLTLFSDSMVPRVRSSQSTHATVKLLADHCYSVKELWCTVLSQHAKEHAKVQHVCRLVGLALYSHGHRLSGLLPTANLLASWATAHTCTA